MFTTTSAFFDWKSARRGSSQRVAKVGTTASSSTLPAPWCAITASVSCSIASSRGAIWRL